MSTVFKIQPREWRMPSYSVVETCKTLPFEIISGAGADAQLMDGVTDFLTSGKEFTQELSSSNDRRPVWLDEVYSLTARGEIDSAIDVLFDHVDDLLLEGDFSTCNELLIAVDLKRLDTNLLIAILSITLSASEKLPNRTLLVSRVEKRLAELAPERLHSLMDGLR